MGSEMCIRDSIGTHDGAPCFELVAVPDVGSIKRGADTKAVAISNEYAISTCSDCHLLLQDAIVTHNDRCLTTINGSPRVNYCASTDGNVS